MKNNSVSVRFNRRKQLLGIMLAMLFAIALIAAFSTTVTAHFAFGSADQAVLLGVNDLAAETDGNAAKDPATGNENDSETVIQESQVETNAPDTKADTASKEPATVQYKVRHFKVNEDGDIELVETEELEGAEGDSVTVMPKEIAGYKFEENFTDEQGNTSKTKGTLSSDEELVLDVYYVVDDAAATDADDEAELSKAAATDEQVDDIVETANLALRSVGNALSAAKAPTTQAASNATGKWGDCVWDLDDSGTLTIHPTQTGDTGSGSLSNALGGNAKNVKKIVFESGVVAPEDCGALFYGMSGLETIDMSGLDMSKATKTDVMFYGCDGLKSVNMSGMTLPKTADMRAFFYGCTALETVNLSNLVVSEAVNMSSMFYLCTSLKSVDMSGLVAEKVTDMGGMFFNCKTLETVDMSNLSAPLLEDMRSFFYGCTSLVNAALSGLNVPSVTNMSAMFSGCESLESVDMSNINAPKVEDLGALFYNCSSLTSVDLSSFDTPSLTNTGAMFSGCESLPSVDVSSLNTSNVTTMLAMFDRCSSLKSLDLSTFDTSSATNMGGMFAECSSLTALDLTSFNTSNVYSMMGMFDGCTSLRALDISSFDTSSIPEAGGTIDDLEKMMSTDFSKLGTKVVEVSLSTLGLPDEAINLPFFDRTIVSNVGGTINMFGRCSSLEYIVVGSKTNPLGMLPAYPINGHTDWYSTKDQRWYTNVEIDQNRLGIADTYTKYGPNPIVISSFTRPLGRSASMPRTGDDNGSISTIALFGATASALVLLALLVGPMRKRTEKKPRHARGRL